jgi:hypothetical protein
MSEDHFMTTKQLVLRHIEQLFEEIEQEMALSHQEKYALLEDAFENASDVDELRVAFDQWYIDHADDLGLDDESEELWDHAVSRDEDVENEDLFDKDEEEEDEDEGEKFEEEEK